MTKIPRSSSPIDRDDVLAILQDAFDKIESCDDELLSLSVRSILCALIASIQGDRSVRLSHHVSSWTEDQLAAIRGMNN